MYKKVSEYYENNCRQKTKFYTTGIEINLNVSYFSMISAISVSLVILISSKHKIWFSESLLVLFISPPFLFKDCVFNSDNVRQLLSM